MEPHRRIRVLTHAGLPTPQRSARLVQGVLGAGMQLVSHGTPHGAVAEDV